MKTTLIALTLLTTAASSVGFAYEPMKYRETMTIVCNQEMSPADCHSAQEATATALDHVAFGTVPANWTFVIVPDHLWRETCKAFGAARCAPTFTNLSTHGTYINQRIAIKYETRSFDEELIRYTQLTGLARLEWMLGHELGHILCHTTDDGRAEDAGNRLRRGKVQGACKE
jgi:hypothetical protein